MFFVITVFIIIAYRRYLSLDYLFCIRFPHSRFRLFGIENQIYIKFHEIFYYRADDKHKYLICFLYFSEISRFQNINKSNIFRGTDQA